MSHIYHTTMMRFPGDEVWVRINEADVAEKAAEGRGFDNGVTFWKNFSGAPADIFKPIPPTTIDMARYKPIIPTMISMDWAPGGLDPKLRKPEEEEHHFEVPPTSPDFKHKRSEIFDLSKRYKEFTLTGQELRDLMNGCGRDGRAAERERHKVQGCPECKELVISMKRKFEDAKVENSARWEAKLKRALNEQANELLSKKTKESCQAYADGLKDAGKQYVGKVDEAYARGLKQGHNEATSRFEVRALRARDMLHMALGLLRGDQSIAKGFLTSAIETLERM